MTQALLLSLIAAMLAFGLPLLLAALGELIGEKSGVLNVGLEGLMLTGALCGAAISTITGNAWLGILGAMAGGIALASVFAFLVITMRADAIVAGTGLNLFALGFTGVAFRAVSKQFPTAQAATVNEKVFYVFALGVCGVLWFVLSSTRAGLVLRACGETPRAAESAGHNVTRVRWISTLCNGALCGLAGAFLAISHTNSFAENMTEGRGFIALSLVIFGRWNPWGALGAALLFGAAQGSQFLLQTRLGDNWYPLLLALPYILTLLVLAGFAGKVRAPAALGEN